MAGACFGEEAGARNLAFFRVKWLMKGTSRVRRLRLRSFQRRIGSPLVFCHVWLFICASFYALVESLIISDCRSQCNGCVILVMICCHVRRYMRVIDVMLQNIL